jgi:hypothetical protein
LLSVGVMEFNTPQDRAALTIDKNLATYTNVFTDKLNPSAEIPADFYMYALCLIFNN